MNILIGLYQPTEGKIFLNGKEVRIESPSQAVKLGIGMVHQHFMLVEAMTVFENIILGDKHAKGLFIDRAARTQGDRGAVCQVRPGRAAGQAYHRDIRGRTATHRDTEGAVPRCRSC
ncbi:MAG: ATP-binding cassette domain-containing protein [Lachnospiraceae bacterium]